MCTVNLNSDNHCSNHEKKVSPCIGAYVSPCLGTYKKKYYIFALYCMTSILRSHGSPNTSVILRFVVIILLQWYSTDRS